MKKKKKQENELVSLCFEPSQPLGVTSGLKQEKKKKKEQEVEKDERREQRRRRRRMCQYELRLLTRVALAYEVAKDVTVFHRVQAKFIFILS